MEDKRGMHVYVYILARPTELAVNTEACTYEVCLLLPEVHNTSVSVVISRATRITQTNPWTQHACTAE